MGRQETVRFVLVVVESCPSAAEPTYDVQRPGRERPLMLKPAVCRGEAARSFGP